MITLRTIAQVSEHIKEQKTRGASIGLVPTMGALHQGHTSLVQCSAKENNCTVTSIFVNPLQFGPQEDFEHYPRSIAKDQETAQNAGADVIFYPEASEIVDEDMLAFVDIHKMQNNLCGRRRPGHFRGVCTIVAKLFNIIQPNRAYFGQKDIQQFYILKKMVRDLNHDIDIIRCPIVREPDGLAMSSRNRYLSKAERQRALYLSRVLFQVRREVRETRKPLSAIRAQAINRLKRHADRVDYLEIADPETLRKARSRQPELVAAAACHIGKTRLIDNVIIRRSCSKLRKTKPL